MKRLFWNQGWLLAMATVALLAAAGCGDDETATGGTGGIGGTGGTGGIGGTGGGGGAGGGDVEPLLFGTWDLTSIGANGTTEDCPGEIPLGGEESVSCGTQTTTFNPDGTFVEVQTTDELGAPYDERQEGTWWTNLDELTLVYLFFGPDEDNLQPIDSPEPQTGTWSLLGSTLTLSFPNPASPGDQLTATLEKQE